MNRQQRRALKSAGMANVADVVKETAESVKELGKFEQMLEEVHSKSHESYQLVEGLVQSYQALETQYRDLEARRKADLQIILSLFEKITERLGPIEKITGRLGPTVGDPWRDMTPRTPSPIRDLIERLRSENDLEPRK